MAETVDHFFRPRRRIDREDGSTAVLTTCCSGAVERAIDIDETRVRGYAIVYAFEAIEDTVSTGWRDRENGSKAVCAASHCRAVERAVDVGQASLWAEPSGLPLKL